MTTQRVATQQQQATETQAILAEAALDQQIAAYSDRLDQIATNYTKAIGDTTAPLRRAMLVADGIDKLRAALTPALMKRIMSLMNSPLGFMTDRPSKKDPTPYPESVVKDCVIDALLQGFYPVGNEMNIIAGRFYGAKSGYERKVRELPGLSDLELKPGIPRIENGRTLVRFGATWMLHGQRKQLTDAEGKPGRVFAIIAYDSSSADNILGKATRKALKAIHEQVTGSTHLIGDDEIDELPTPGESGTANAAGTPPVGRVPLKNGPQPVAEQPTTAPEPAAVPAAVQTGLEQARAGQFVDGPDLAADAKLVEGIDAQDEMALMDLLSDLDDAVHAATSREQLQDVGRRMNEHRKWMGEANYDQLVAKYRAKYNTLPGKKP